MDQQLNDNSLPEKVLRRHVEILTDLLPEMARRILEDGRPADVLLNRYLRTHRELGSRDRRFLSQAVFSFFRWRGWSVNRLELPPLEACLLGTALDTDPLPESFTYLAARCSLPIELEAMGTLPVEQKRVRLNEQLADREDFRPLELNDLVLEEFTELTDPSRHEACLIEFQHRPPAWIRCRTDPYLLVQALADREVEGRIHDHVTAALAVDAGISLAHALAPHAAQFVVQDLASQCVGLVCAPQQGEEWWDCCSGSGGKSLHLMDLMQQEGRILATDVRPTVLKELKKRARRHGLRHIRTQPFNAVSDEPFRKTFDGVVIDAPCSGWGTWSRNPDARWRTSRRDVVQCANRQLKILDNAKWCVSSGGRLVYAVCTMTRPETEEVVMNFLDRHSDFKLEPFAHPLTGEPTDGQVQLWPWEGPGDGMFIARFRKEA